MAITINGSGTITGISAGGYPDGTVTAADLASTLDLSSKTLTLPSGVGGRILQVQSDTAYATSTHSVPGSYTQTSGLSVTLTPASTSSRFVILVSLYADGTGTSYGGFQIRRGTSTDVGVEHYWSRTAGVAAMIPVFGVDAPATTSSLTYYLYSKTDGGTVYAGRYTMIVYEVSS